MATSHLLEVGALYWLLICWTVVRNQAPLSNTTENGVKKFAPDDAREGKLTDSHSQLAFR